MDIFNADLHIHSPHSIAVSKSLNLDSMLVTCKKKGLNILGTGDILQPEWLKYMESNLQKKDDGSFSYKDVYFILQTEVEDIESIHHVVLFPDFNSVREIQNKLQPYSKNILDEWGGRPRVNLSPPELVDIIFDSGGIVGPAHAFTPFKAIFRQGKFKTMQECYQDAVENVYFLELGLSANTDLADRLGSLKSVSFLSNSDAHSQDPRSLGREFNRLDLENPSFEELLLALKRKDNRKITLNVGLNPKLGKYYNMFCNKCRRRVIFKKSKKLGISIFSQYSKTEDFLVYYSEDPDIARKQYIDQVAKNKMVCPACKEEKSKNFKVKLGVSERIEKISTSVISKHPDHRPKYIDAIPLVDIIRSVKRIKSTTSKVVLNTYNKMIQDLGKEFEILIDIPLNKIEEFDLVIASVINGLRNNEIEYIPGGGGIYGQINLDI
ncbi:MAG: endonuclease Q family protein [Candidatus Thorarchaeota archaeon]